MARTNYRRPLAAKSPVVFLTHIARALSRCLWSALAITACFSIASAAPAHAEILLGVDATDPSAVTFTATEGLSAASSTGDGYRLLLRNFQRQENNSFVLMTGDLRTFLGTYDYGVFSGISTVPTGLMLLRDVDSETQTFTQGQRALVGSEVADMTSFSLRGTSGVFDIEVWDNFGIPTGIIIGQYQFTAPAVPEPSSCALLACASWLVLRRPSSKPRGQLL